MFIVCCRKCELKVLHNVQSAFGQWITNYLHIDYTNKDFFGRHQGEDSIKSELRQIPVVQIMMMTVHLHTTEYSILNNNYSELMTNISTCTTFHYLFLMSRNYRLEEQVYCIFILFKSHDFIFQPCVHKKSVNCRRISVVSWDWLVVWTSVFFFKSMKQVFGTHIEFFWFFFI